MTAAAHSANTISIRQSFVILTTVGAEERNWALPLPPAVTDHTSLRMQIDRKVYAIKTMKYDYSGATLFIVYRSSPEGDVVPTDGIHQFSCFLHHASCGHASKDRVT